MTHFILSLILSLGFLSPQQTDLAAEFSRAVALQQAGSLREAADQYRAVIKLKPDYAEAHANLGVVLSRLGDYAGAVASYEAALRLKPELKPILLNLGIAHYRAGRPEPAVNALRQFLTAYPQHLQARQLLGISLVEVGQNAEGLALLEATLNEAPRDAAVLYSIGLAHLRLNKPGVLATLEKLAAFPEGLPALRLLQGQAFLYRQEYEKALEELQAAAELNANLPRVYYSLGLANLRLNRNKEAIAAFERELTTRPDDFSTLYYLAVLNEAESNLDAAKSRLDAALKLDPQSADANGLLAKILRKQGKNAEALAPLQLAVAKDPTDPIKRYTLAQIYRDLGRREDAAHEFAEVQRLKAEQLKNDRSKLPKP